MSFSWKLVFVSLFSINLVAVRKITVNDQDIREILSPGKCALTIRTKKGTYPALRFEDGNLSVLEFSLDKKEVDRLKKLHGALSNNQGGFFSRKLTLSSPTGDYAGSKFSASEAMVVGRPGGFLKIRECLLDSPEIILLGKHFELACCFIEKPNVVQLLSDQENALIGGIDLTFSKSSSVPYMINGTINLEEGTMENEFVALGAEAITIQFNEDMIFE